MNETKTYISWGTSAVVIALFALGFSAARNAHPEPPRPSASPSPSPTPDPKIVEAEIRMAVEQGDQAEIDALRSGDASGLPRYFIGEALKHERKIVQDMADAGRRQESTLHKITFDEIKPGEDGTSAEVRVTERWSYQIFDIKTDAKVSESEERDLPQNVTLVRTSGEGWRIAAISWDRPEPTPPPAPTPQPIRITRQEEDDDIPYALADSSVRERIQARYDERAAAFERRDLDGYFAYAAHDWAWRSETGDRSSLAESREYYRRVFARGESRSLETKILKAYEIDEDTVVTGVLIGTAKAGDEGRLIGQLDLWVRRGGEWYCLRERRLARSDAFSLSALRDALKS